MKQIVPLTKITKEEFHELLHAPLSTYLFEWEHPDANNYLRQAISLLQTALLVKSQAVLLTTESEFTWPQRLDVESETCKKKFGYDRFQSRENYDGNFAPSHTPTPKENLRADLYDYCCQRSENNPYYGQMAVALMLLGYALELLLKSALLQKNLNGKGHELDALYQQIIGSSTTPEDLAQLKQLSRFIIWRGRYPNPMPKQISEETISPDQELRKQIEQDCGVEVDTSLNLFLDGLRIFGKIYSGLAESLVNDKLLPLHAFKRPDLFSSEVLAFLNGYRSSHIHTI